MHDVVTGFYEPNDDDLAAGIMGGFGTAINIINGQEECGTEDGEEDFSAS